MSDNSVIAEVMPKIMGGEKILHFIISHGQSSSQSSSQFSIILHNHHNHHNYHKYHQFHQFHPLFHHYDSINHHKSRYYYVKVMSLVSNRKNRIIHHQKSSFIHFHQELSIESINSKLSDQTSIKWHHQR